VASFQGVPHSSHDLGGPVFGDNPDDEPPQPLQELQPANVFEVLVSVKPVVVTVIFHGDHEIWPAQIEVSDRTAVRAKHGNLGAGARQTSLEEKQPQITFAW